MEWCSGNGLGFRLPLHLDHAVEHPLQLKEAIHAQLALPTLQVRTAGWGSTQGRDLREIKGRQQSEH